MYRFSTSNFKRFSSILDPFGRPKIDETSQFFEKIEVRRPPLKHYCFRAAFWIDFEALGTRFAFIFVPPEAVLLTPTSNLEKSV